MHQPQLCLPEDQTYKHAPFEGSNLPRGRDLCSSALNRTLVNLLRLCYKAPTRPVPLINRSHSYSRKSYLWLLASISFLFKAYTHPSIWSRAIKHTFPITNQMAFRKISFFPPPLQMNTLLALTHRTATVWSVKMGRSVRERKHWDQAFWEQEGRIPSGTWLKLGFLHGNIDGFIKKNNNNKPK